MAQQTSGGSAAATPAPDLSAIVNRLEQRIQENRGNTRPYSIIRNYQLYGSDTEKANSEVLARINFLPPNRVTYEVLESRGSGRGVGIVRHVLDNETEIRKKPEDHDLTRQNYEFTYGGERKLDGHRCYVLNLEPKRKTEELIKGEAWIDADTYQVRLVQGEPARSPSWWVKKLQVTMKYGDVGGIWTPVSTDAVADVRLFGKHMFSSREVSASVGSTVAAMRPATLDEAALSQSTRPAPLAAAGAVRKRANRRMLNIPAVVGAEVPVR